MARRPSAALTDAESEVMAIVWRLHPASVGDVVTAMNERRAVSYSTVQTMLRILEAKGYDFLYWSKELVRSRPVISITHVSTAAIDDSPIAYAIASKQIYAMHYYDASLGLTLLLPDRTTPYPATYVVYLNRSRIDLFEGAFGGVTRRPGREPLSPTNCNACSGGSLRQRRRRQPRTSADGTVLPQSIH